VFTAALVALLLVAVAAEANSRIVFDRNGKIWKMNDDGTNETALTNPTWPDTDSHPSICPNGRAIVFDRAGHIYKIGQNGGTPVNLTPNSQGYDHDPDCGWDADEHIYVVYASDEEGNTDIYRILLTGGTPVNLTDDSDLNEDQPSICGDDRFVFMRPDGTGDDLDLFIRDLDDGDNEIQITANGYHEEFPACKPNADKVAFARRLDQDTEFTDIIEVVIATGAEVDLTETTEQDVKDYYPSYSPGGTYFAFSRTTPSLNGVYEVFKQLTAPGETAEQLTPDQGYSGQCNYPDWAELAP